MPITAPATVPTLSDSIAFSISFTLPFESTFPATFATEVNVPAVSKKSTKNSVKITEIIPPVIPALKSKLIKCVIGSMLPTTPLNLLSPATQATILKARIPIMILPLTLSFSKTIIVTNARQAKIIIGSLRFPNFTSVAGLSTTTPIICKPIIAKNNPIPAPIPSFRLFGIELIIHALNGVSDIAKKTTPATSTAPKAWSGL